MIPTQADVDHWQIRSHEHLALARAAILDVIDCGTPVSYPSPRRPDAREQSRTERATSPDGLMQPTAKSQSARSGRSDPVGRAVTRWESDVQKATTDLFGAVTQLVDVVDQYGLTPVDEDGRKLTAPAEPATRVTSVGHTVIDVHPGACREATLACTDWAGAALDAFAARMRNVTDPDAGDSVIASADWIAVTLRSLVRRLDAEPVRLCACGCKAPAPPVGQGATRAACRKRQSRNDAA